MIENQETVPDEVKERPSAFRIVREIVETVVAAFVLFFVIQLLVQNFGVHGLSMEPSVHSGQVLMVNKVVYFSIDGDLARKVPFLQTDSEGDFYIFHPPRRGEVIVFRPPIPSNEDYIKRVIGVPGDVVSISGGTVILNGKPLEEPYIAYRSNDFMDTIIVPAGQYFVLGDNRSNSRDSRSWGMLPGENIIGKAWLTYWPLDKLGFLQNNPPPAP